MTLASDSNLRAETYLDKNSNGTTV